MKLFLSFKFDDQEFIELVYYMLSKQAVDLFYWPRHGRHGVVNELLVKPLDECDGMIAFLGAEWGGKQEQEIAYFLNHQNGRPFIPAQIVKELPPRAQFAVANRLVETRTFQLPDFDSARELAKGIVTRGLRMPWIPEDGLPSRYIVKYEKEFLEKFRQQDPKLLLDLRTECGWTEWPRVIKQDAELPNPITDKSIGALSDGSHEVLLDARTSVQADGHHLTFPEARPRTHLRYPLRQGGILKVAILVSGGIAPGINAVIDGIVSRHSLYSERQNAAGRKHGLQILGYREGFKSLLPNGLAAQLLTGISVRDVVEAGGAFLGTSREDKLLPGRQNREAKLLAAVQRLHANNIDILYVIGGEGSMSCAHALWHYARSINYDLSVVGIPKAMDNDILWVWQSFGFLSAVEEARHAILHMHTEVSSNPRVAIVQLFGSDSGFIASHAGYSTACDLVLIPEDPLSMDEIADHVGQKLMERYRNGLGPTSPYAIVVMAETALPKDAARYSCDPHVGLSEDEQRQLRIFVENDRSLRGQTPDDLRRAGLKIVSRVLEQKIQANLTPQDYWEHFRVITNEPRHLIRSIPPSVTDVIFGERLGALAVDNAMAGYTDFMVSQWLTEFVLVPLPLVVLGRKRVPKEGIFWKSVISKTQQPTSLPPAPAQSTAAPAPTASAQP
jgi:6-phosphofructokinase 1